MAATKNEDDFRFHHEVLGDILGLSRGDDLVQFRGIPFATIPSRFRQSEPALSLPQRPFDARLPGLICPQVHLPYPGYWDGPVPAGFPHLPHPKSSEFECLNLNITVPRSLLGRSLKSIPVLLFFHGGALMGGSQSIQIAGREIHDPADLVRTSVSRQQPLVVVTANYRIGPLGFLASRELVADNALAGGPVGNYGLHDQRRAIEWCSRFIAGFGGDSANLTIHGSSAGAVSCHYHCTFPREADSAGGNATPLFQRAILSSGTFLSNGPMPVEHHQGTFDGYVERAQGGSSEDPVAFLRSVPIHHLIASAPDDVRWEPFADGTWVKADILSAYQEINQPLPDIMLGAAEYERESPEHNLSLNGKPRPNVEMLSRAQTTLRANKLPLNWASFPASYPSIVAAYALDKPLPGSTDTPLDNPGAAIKVWADLIADMVFRIPPLFFAKLAARHPASGKVYLYSIHATNPFPRWKPSFRKANHAINEIFLFNAAPDRILKDEPGLVEGYLGAVADMQRAWIQFAYGEEPWSPCKVQPGGEVVPIYVFQNGQDGKECTSLGEAEGDDVSRRWSAVLAAAEAAR